MRYGHRDDVSVLRLEGSVRYPQASAMRRFVDDVVLREAGELVCIDLRDVDFIDSTGLGLLARIGRFTLEERGRRTVIVCPDGNVSQCLRAMAFDKVFDLQAEPPQDVMIEVQNVPGAEGAGERGALREVMLDAHKELSSVDTHNHELFKDVIDRLEKDH